MIKPQFSLEKALQFVGDNSTYQKKQLLFLGIVILTFATLNCQVPLISNSLTVYFLLFSGIGQFICPSYMSIRTITICLIASSILCLVFYPITSSLFHFGICLIGLFGRGLFASSLLYIHQIGGQKYRAWSCTVVLGLWAISPLILSLERFTKLSLLWWVILFLLLPLIIGGYFVLTNWNPSPLHLYSKKLFKQTKDVLNEIAAQNNRPALPYGLQGEQQTEKDDEEYKRMGYGDLLSRQFTWKITMPLAIVWIYREYVYYSSYIILPELGYEISRNLILLSVSEIVAILMSYPIRLKIKRVNALFGFTFLIAICSFLSSFTSLSPECMKVGQSCASKYIYRISIMLIRFSIALIGSILINYTLQVYPADVRKLGFSLCLGISAIGSTVMPWIVRTFIYVDLSGFISFGILSVLCLYVILKMEETNGNMKNQTLNDLQNNKALISLRTWAQVKFN